MIIYNKDLAAGAPLPRTMEELATPPFAARTCIANPLFGTTAIHLAAVFRKWGTDRGRAWLQDFARTGGKMVASNGEVKRRVAAGDFAWGLTDSDDVHVALTEGKPIGWIALDVCIPAAAVLIRGAPHPDPARKLAAFLASAEVEQMLATSEAAHFPVRPAEAPPPTFGPLPFPPEADMTYWRGVEETLQTLLRGDLQQWVDAQR
jgi:iron(III) transport system substrate-binding protein